MSSARNRTERVIQTINESLWDEFGLNRIDDEEATGAYRELCRAVDGLPEGGTQLFFATTNYDRAGEEALGGVGFDPDDGSRRRRFGAASVLDAAQVKPWGPPMTVPYLHLHGAVGWYRDATGIRIEPADRRFDERETPAVLYPDPTKDLYNDTDTGVHTLWAKFEDALTTASHVLVLGHSLNDRPLVKLLAEKPGANVRYAFTYFDDDGREVLATKLKAMPRFEVPQTDVSFIRCDFHAEFNFSEFTEWTEGNGFR